jgi:N-acetylmuramoyl-L-alanine amidase
LAQVTRIRRLALVAGLASLAAPGLAPECASAARAAQPAATSAQIPAKPDRALFLEAQAALKALRASPSRSGRRAEWEKVVLKFRRVVGRYPQSGYCDDALLAVGDLYREMAARFKAPRLLDDAVQAYRSLVSGYPSSRHGETALYAVVEIARASGDRKRLEEAVRQYGEAYPDSKRADAVAKLVRREPSKSKPASLSAPKPGLTRVFNLRFWSGDASTRVVLDLEREVPFRHDRIAHPDRLWIDLAGTRLHPNLKDRSFPVGDGLLEQVRLGQNQADVVRVVLDFKEVKDHTVFYLYDPVRLVVDVRATPAPLVASQPAASRPGDADPASGAKPDAGAEAAETVIASPPRTTSAEAPPQSELPRRSLEPLRPPPPPQTEKRTAEALAPIEGAPPVGAREPGTPAARAGETGTEPAAPAPPKPNRAGSYSLARQLGLGARTVVIDPGHGGHDPGSIGRGGLAEKDLVLDLGLRLERMLREELGTEVVMTRSTDIFVPLEERTAIANTKRADLFLSIHANSSRSPRARGIETYFLNFAVDPHAEEVAARENAISAATLKDLQNLVKAIALNSKIDESRDFAASIQEAMVTDIRGDFPEVQNRGVRQAPFYVLIGANMPSILAEIAFISNPAEEKLLKASAHRERLARNLFEGVQRYLEGLDRTRVRQATAPVRRPSAAKGGRQ